MTLAPIHNFIAIFSMVEGYHLQFNLTTRSRNKEKWFSAQLIMVYFHSVMVMKYTGIEGVRVERWEQHL
jgi:hypothetical protein